MGGLPGFKDASKNQACVTTGNNCTSGKVADGVAAGGSLTVNLTMPLTTPLNGIFGVPEFEAAFLSDAGIVVKFQGISVCGRHDDDDDHGACDGDYSVTLAGQQTSIPEPGTLVLLSLGLVGLGAMARRARR